MVEKALDGDASDSISDEDGLVSNLIGISHILFNPIFIVILLYKKINNRKLCLFKIFTDEWLFQDEKEKFLILESSVS